RPCSGGRGVIQNVLGDDSAQGSRVARSESLDEAPCDLLVVGGKRRWWSNGEENGGRPGGDLKCRPSTHLSLLSWRVGDGRHPSRYRSQDAACGALLLPFPKMAQPCADLGHGRSTCRMGAWRIPTTSIGMICGISCAPPRPGRSPAGRGSWASSTRPWGGG